MNVNNISEAFTLPLRLSLVSCLINGEKTFSEIKNITNASDGNISVQLSKLENMKIVTSNKILINKKNLTIYRITEFGLTSLQEYVLFLENILNTYKCIEENT